MKNIPKSKIKRVLKKDFVTKVELNELKLAVNNLTNVVKRIAFDFNINVEL
jgi:hypothetical protein